MCFGNKSRRVFDMTLLRLTLLLFAFIPSSLLAANTDNTALVETAWLAKNLNNVVVLDIRTNKKNFLLQPVFKTKGNLTLVKLGGHIPGARLILYKNVRGDRTIDGKTIKHMAVTGDQFEKLMQNAGVNQDSHIVITTNAESTFDLTMAARMYWQVKYFGHDNVSILNGGTAQWLLDGHKFSITQDKPEPGNWQAQKARASIFADSNETMTASENSDTQLVDVRPLGQYLGAFKSSKAKEKGHIPTAKIFPVDLFSDHKSPVKFISANELKQLATALGVDGNQPLITYCNSGHMASGAWFAFHEILGNKNVKLYDGSMHQWTHENRPVVSMKME